MRAKRIYEFGGAGFAYGGGSSTLMGRGGVNRGGFGGANNLGGPNMMYTYEIKPLNRTLQPDPLGSPEIEEIKPGNDISGREVNKRDGELRVGSLHRVVRAEDGSVKYYEIMDTNSATYIRIDPTTAQLISKMDGVDPLGVRMSKEEEELMHPGDKSVNSMETNESFKLVKESLNEGYSEFKNIKEIYIAVKHLLPRAIVELHDEWLTIYDEGNKYEIEFGPADWGDYNTGAIFIDQDPTKGHEFLTIDKLAKLLDMENERDRENFRKYQEDGSHGENFE